jgi:VWFA-related protein
LSRYLQVRCLLAAGAALCLLCPLGSSRTIASAEQAAFQGSSPERRTTSPGPSDAGSLTKIFVTVGNSKGGLIWGLPKQAFHLFENGKEQKIELFEPASSEPLSVGLLIDTSASRTKEMPGAEREPALRFFNSLLRKGDAGFVATFSADVHPYSDLTGELARLDQAVEEASAVKPRGRTHLFDAIIWACEKILGPQPGRKALVVLTDVEDTGSRDDWSAALRSAQRTDTALYVMIVPDPNWRLVPFADGTDPRAFLQRLDETGGFLRTIEQQADFSPIFAGLAEVLREGYVLGYTPANSRRDGKFRKVRVTIERRGLRVLARRGYYAPGS